MVSVPNAERSQKNLENISRRDKFWFHQVFGLRYDTSPQQMRTILTGIEESLRNEPSVEPATSRVRFIGFGESSLTLEIFAYLMVPDNDTFLVAQQKLLLAILEVISSAEASITSRAIVADWKLPPPRGSGAARFEDAAGPSASCQRLTSSYSICIGTGNLEEFGSFYKPNGVFRRGARASALRPAFWPARNFTSAGNTGDLVAGFRP